MKRLICLIAITLLCLCEAGCRETAGSLNDKALKAFMAGRREEAVGFFKQALAYDPTDLKARFYLGWIYEMQGKPDEGIAEYKKALEKNPNHGGVHNRLAGIYLTRDMLDEAIASFKKVVALDPGSATAYYGLGVAYLRKGQFAEAGEALFEAGLLAILRNNRTLAVNAYAGLKETGNQQLAAELQAVLSPWFDPANEAAAQPQSSRSQR